MQPGSLALVKLLQHIIKQAMQPPRRHALACNRAIYPLKTDANLVHFDFLSVAIYLLRFLFWLVRDSTSSGVGSTGLSRYSFSLPPLALGFGRSISM